ncbi:MAG TPA: hypothetical protein VFV81_08200 [Verrucomicrobiae bacterium]|nr:hypothetical protein [Verrucomicrobiae bacterium]
MISTGKMVGAINCITTRGNRWKQHCSDWADARDEFQIVDVEPYHMAFCQAVCWEYDYVMCLSFRAGRPVYSFYPAECMEEPEAQPAGFP